MKKSTIITIACFTLGVILLTVLFIACTDNNISNAILSEKQTTTTTGTQTATPEPTPEYTEIDFFKEDVSKWITLGQYKDITVKVDQLKITDADIDLQVHTVICQNDLHSKQLSGVVTEKVIFHFDYTGYLLKEDGSRGEAFEGGSSNGAGQLAYIDGTDFVTVSKSGLGGFIDGFAQGMIGMSVGETRTLDITFPENYTPTMAGKKVEFDVKVNYIAKTELDNDIAKHLSNNQYSTVKEYRNYVKQELEVALTEQNHSYALMEILNNVTLVATPEMQTEYVFGLLCAELEYYVQMYTAYGMQVTFVDILKQMAGFNTVEELRAYSEEYAKSEQGQMMIKSNALPHAIVKDENLEVTDEEFDIFMESLVKQTGSTKEDLIAQYTEEYIKQVILVEEANSIIEEIQNNAKYVLE